MPTTPIDPDDGYDPEVSKHDPPQAMRLFNDETEADVPLDPTLDAFDRVQGNRLLDDE